MKKSLLLLALLLGLAGALRSDIALTNPEARRSVIGGTGTINYDRVRITSITVNPATNGVTAAVELFVSTDSSRLPIRGTYSVSAQTLQARLLFEGLAFEHGVSLTAAQGGAVASAIAGIRADVESSLVNFGLVAGTVQ